MLAYLRESDANANHNERTMTCWYVSLEQQRDLAARSQLIVLRSERVCLAACRTAAGLSYSLIWPKAKVALLGTGNKTRLVHLLAAREDSARARFELDAEHARCTCYVSNERSWPHYSDAGVL